jgi:hypothetical protein
MERPPYSPDLGANDFWLLQKIPSPLKGRRFQDTDDIEKCEDAIELFHNRSSIYFQHRQHRWSKCIAAQGEYFEGDPCQ